MTQAAAHDHGAEQAVIGAALLAPHLMADLAATLAPGDFHRPAHSVLWQAMCTMRAAGTPTDTITVAAHLADIGDLLKVGGVPYLHTLIAEVPSTGNAGHYARRVTELAQRRKVADLGGHLTRLAASGADPADLVAAGRALLDDAGTPGGWSPLIPLGRGRHLPVFPAELLPTWVAEQVFAVAEFTQTPIDLAGSLALACLSTASGGWVVVEVRGSWREPTNLYTVVVLPPGSRKSAVFAAMIAPILAAEKALIKRTAPAIIEAEIGSKVATKAAEKAAQAAANADVSVRDTLIAEATAAAMDAEAIIVPAKPQLVADDVTSETAAHLLAQQNGRLAVLSPEGGIFATIAGRYSGTPNLEVFLKGHAGDMMRVGRLSRDAEHVDQPALTMGLAVQPEILRDIANMPGFRGLGLLARILFAIPENTVGRRSVGADPVPEQVAFEYTNTLHDLILDLARNTEPQVLQLSPEANELVLNIERTVEPRLGPGGAWAHIVDWGSKYTGAVIRIAGLLHLAEHLGKAFGMKIDADTMERASMIGDYYAAHALAAFDDMGADQSTRNARTILAWIERTTTTAFTKREVFRALKSSQLPTAADFDAPLAVLETHGYLRPIETASPKPTGGRPPSPSYLVHPEVHQPTATIHPIPTTGRAA